MSRSRLEELERELNTIREQYALLKQEKETIETRYEQDIRKWKRFKKWLLHGDKNDRPPATDRACDGRTNYESFGAEKTSSFSELVVSGVALDGEPDKIVLPIHEHAGLKQTNDENSLALDDKLSGSLGGQLSTQSLPAQPPSRRPVGHDASTAAGTSINSRYRLNPIQNNGLSYQFHEVVRNKHDRARLDADDCECCRDYYNAIGTLPPKAQPPLWRSPPSTPRKRKRTSEYADTSESGAGNSPIPRDPAVLEHVRHISRHRRRWEAPQTPPGYWDIGFPDTQETDRINERAREIHENKMRDAEAEASIGGRYLRR